MSTDNNNETKTLAEMVAMKDEDFAKLDSGQSEDSETSEGTTSEKDASPEKDTTDESKGATEEDEFKGLSQEDIIKQLKAARDENSKLKQRVSDQKTYIDRKNTETGELRKAVEANQKRVKELEAEYDSNYLSDPAKARKISSEISKLEEKSKADSEKLQKLETTTKNFEVVVDIHPDIDNYVDALVDKWSKEPDNSTAENKRILEEFKTNYRNMVVNPMWLIKELNDVKISKAKSTTKKSESAIDKLKKASEHSTQLNGEPSESDDMPSYDLVSLIKMNDETFDAFDKKIRS